MGALPEARRSIAPDDMPLPPPETRIEEVYRLACRFYGVNANSALMRQLKQAKENYITTLDLSSNYVGIKGLKPVLALLRFNSCHLISLSLAGYWRTRQARTLFTSTCRSILSPLRRPPAYRNSANSCRIWSP